MTKLYTTSFKGNNKTANDILRLFYFPNSATGIEPIFAQSLSDTAFQQFCFYNKCLIK